jgi:hypothetical protein
VAEFPVGRSGKDLPSAGVYMRIDKGWGDLIWVNGVGIMNYKNILMG